tara:strand:+ start:160 stop:666 length:507 start_codon:yes stop_codon:yes gene_type:complete
MTDPEMKKVNSKLERIGELLNQDTPKDYMALRTSLEEARDLFHEVLAERLRDSFNDHLASEPHESAIEKRSLSRAANADLRGLGLAIKCPKTGEPAHLRGVADTETGRFQLCLTANSSYARSVTSKQLPTLDLMIRPTHGGPNPSKDSSWAQRAVDQKNSSNKSQRGE